MLIAAYAPEVQAGSEHVASPASGSPRRPVRRCSCLACNPANGSFYFRCIKDADIKTLAQLDSPPDPLDAIFDDNRLIQASLLNRQEKALVWGYIQRNEPQIVLFLQDESVARLIKSGATPLFPTDLVEKALGYCPR